MRLYPNGIQIYCNRWFNGYPITVSNSIENGTSRDDTNISHQNSPRQPYTLPVRVLLWGTRIMWDTIIEIVGHELNWQQILEDIELNRVQLGWHLLDSEEHIEVFGNSFEDFAFRGPPPAARSAVDSLEIQTIEDRDFLYCVCQATLLAGEKCVNCKFELPTDDPDYEARKQRRNRWIVQFQI
ncbi:hypothetical protein SUGI_0465040 [Cryptomeria japonica]|nr:hypothetical protein SUGI_0465040 [Cryptomeria japonica]